MNCQNKMTYTIKAGDNLYQIAKRYHTTVEDIMQLNPHLHPQRLQIGEVIYLCPHTINSNTTPTHSTSHHSTYTIQQGDNLFQIAKRFNTTVQELERLNPGIQPHFLQIGQVINVPGSSHSTTNQAHHGSTFVYTIQQGDNLYQLSKRFGTTVDAIIALNPGIQPRFLQIGQQILIPGTGVTPMPIVPKENSFVYTIQQGDTLYSLANRYGTSVDAIIALNPGIQPRFLQIGQQILIPGTGSTVPTEDSFVYTIKQGDTLYSLAKQYGTSVDAIMALNPGIRPHFLQIGQQILIPKTVMVTPEPITPLPQPITPPSTQPIAPLPQHPTLPTPQKPMIPQHPIAPIPQQPTLVPSTPPVTPTTKKKFKIYVIKPGDSLPKIAEKHQTSVEDILYLNPHLHPQHPQTGISIHIDPGNCKQNVPETIQPNINQMIPYTPNTQTKAPSQNLNVQQPLIQNQAAMHQMPMVCTDFMMYPQQNCFPPMCCMPNCGYPPLY